MPPLTPEQWRNPGPLLSDMYAEAEAKALSLIDYYLRDRVRKRTYSRVLRGAAIVLAAAGGLQPLVSAAGDGTTLGWGYVLLAAAGVCVAFDHFLGLSAGWMRDIVTAHQVQHRLQEFQFDWAAMNADDARPEKPAHVTQEYLALLRTFTTDISTLMMEETSQWQNEFQSGLAQTNTPGTR